MKPDCFAALAKIIAFFPSVKGATAEQYSEAIYEQTKYIAKDEWEAVCFRVAGQIGERLPRAQEFKGVHARLKDEKRVEALNALVEKPEGPLTTEQLCADALELTPEQARSALEYHRRARGPIRPELGQILEELAAQAPPPVERAAPVAETPKKIVTPTTTEDGRGKGSAAKKADAAPVPSPVSLLRDDEEPL